jgi:hypothetical protein
MLPQNHRNHFRSSPKVRPIRKWLTIIFGTILIIASIWLVVSTYRAVTAVRSLLESKQQVELILDSGLMRANPNELNDLTTSVRGDILTLRSAVGPAANLFPLLSWLPKYGPLLANGRELLELADLGSEAGLYAMRAVTPALAAAQSKNIESTGPIPAVAQSLVSSSADFKRASEALHELRVIREEITVTGAWPVKIQSLMSEFDNALPISQDALILGQVLPELLGSEGRQTYLLIAQNEDELRPTGGFISGAGILVIEDGNILSIDFENANLIDDWKNKPYGFPPLPFYEFMGMDIFLFRDANFWPDFPTSAETTMQLYTYGKDMPLNGIIAFNQKFVQLLLEATGPIYIPELDITVNSNNVINAMRQEWGPSDGQADWIQQRKAFMGPFANGFISHITGDLLSMDLRKIGENVHIAVGQRDLQLYMRDPSVAQSLAKAGWDGRLMVIPDQDYLMLVETNLGFNKANAAVSRSVSYEVTLDERGVGSAYLTIDYSHSGDIVNQECLHGTTYSSVTQYEDLIADCYWNYLRVLVPAGSQLSDASNHPVPAEQLLVDHSWNGNARLFDEPDSGYSYFDNFLLLPAGQTTLVTFRYLLPGVVTSEPGGVTHYHLAVDKQSGTGNQPLMVTVNLPPGSEFIASNPSPTEISEQSIMFEIELTKGYQIDVQYQ